MDKNYNRKITKHKFLETGISTSMGKGFSFALSLNLEQDHAGIYFSLWVWKLFFEFNIYDDRHWDEETNDWVKYDEEEEEKP